MLLIGPDLAISSFQEKGMSFFQLNVLRCKNSRLTSCIIHANFQDFFKRLFVSLILLLIQTFLCRREPSFDQPATMRADHDHSMSQLRHEIQLP